MRYFLTFFLLAILATTSLYGQKGSIKNRFNAGIIMGVNTSQINGDRYLGYDKFGVFAGFRAIAKINRSNELVFEMQYNRKGSRDPEQFVPGQSSSRFIALDYIEIPFLYHKRVKINIGTGSIEGGIAFARLFGFNINENDKTINYASFLDIQDDFNNNEFSLILGGGVFIVPQQRRQSV